MPALATPTATVALVLTTVNAIIKRTPANTGSLNSTETVLLVVKGKTGPVILGAMVAERFLMVQIC